LWLKGSSDCGDVSGFGVLRYAQDDGEEQAAIGATAKADPPPGAKDDKGRVRIGCWLRLKDGVFRWHDHGAGVVGGEASEDALGTDVLVDDRERRQVVGAAGFADYGVGVL
jgi:hypothetical protein